MDKTGDMGKWLEGGTVEYMGRNDDQVKIRGYRIELGEIAGRMIEREGVREAVVVVVVVARGDAAGEKRLVAYWAGVEASAEEWRGWLRAKLPEYMIPAAYVRVEEMPLAANGNIDRKKLPAPEKDAFARPVYEPPSGELEKLIAGVWADALHLETVGRKDNFIDLGGHSLLTIRVANRLDQAGIPITAIDLFTCPTVESLAVRIEARQAGPGDRAVCISKGGLAPPLFLAHCSHGELIYAPALAAHIDETIPVYGLPPVAPDRKPLRTIEGMAARMVRMIREVQPFGPYRVAGWSFGGMLAYEIAVQLIGVDEEVEFLGLFDTVQVRGIAEYPKSAQIGAHELNGANVHLESAFSAETLEITDEFVRKCREFLLIPSHWTSLTASQVQRLIARNHSNLEAAVRYSAAPVSIFVHLFLAQEKAHGSPFMGWENVVPKERIRVVAAAGTHYSMMAAPNVQKLGESISVAIRTSGENRPAKTQYSPLVLLHRGSDDADPVFIAPGAGASAASLIELVSNLDGLRPVYGLQPRGMDGNDLPHVTVEAAAASYVRALGGRRLQRPIHLLGHSFGGWVALEMANRLADAGHPVASLTIVDSNPPEDDLTEIQEFDGVEAIMEWISIIELLRERPFGVARSELEKRNDDGRRALLHAGLVKEGLLTRRSEPATLRGPLRAFGAALRASFRPEKAFYGPTQLVLVDDRSLDAAANHRKRADFTGRWRRWAPNLVPVHTDGNHMTVFQPPHVHALAQLVRRFQNQPAKSGMASAPGS
jgi:thioesterase domain-containing protein